MTAPDRLGGRLGVRLPLPRWYVVALAIALAVFAFTTVEVVTNGWLVHLDHWLQVRVRWHVKRLEPVLSLIRDVGDPRLGAVCAIGACAAVSARRRSWRPLAIAVLAVGAVALVVTLGKIWVARPVPRAGERWVSAPPESFPSGHAAGAVVLWGMVLRAELDWRRPALLGWLLHALFAVTVGFTMFLLGAHWFSDVVGGLAVGYALLLASDLLMVRPLGTAGRHPPGLLAVPETDTDLAEIS